MTDNMLIGTNCTDPVVSVYGPWCQNGGIDECIAPSSAPSLSFLPSVSVEPSAAPSTSTAPSY